MIAAFFHLNRKTKKKKKSTNYCLSRLFIRPSEFDSQIMGVMLPYYFFGGGVGVVVTHPANVRPKLKSFRILGLL